MVTVLLMIIAIHHIKKQRAGDDAYKKAECEKINTTFLRSGDKFKLRTVSTDDSHFQEILKDESKNDEQIHICMKPIIYSLMS